MPVGTKEEEAKTASEKISQSSGDDTQKYADQLEANSDKLITQLNEQREETGKKAEEQVDELNKNLDTEEETKKAEEEGGKSEEEAGKEKEKPDEKKEEEVDDEIKPDDDDTLESLAEKLTKSEKRVKDNRTAFTKNKQEVREQGIATNAVIENLNKTVLDLQEKFKEKATATTAEEGKVADKEVKKELVNLNKQFEILNNVDPDIAGPIKEIIKGLQDTYSGEITSLKTELKSKTESDQKSAQQVSDDTHYGKIEAAHSDWEDVVDSPEFDAYIEALSPRQKILARQDIENGSAENIIELFDDYKVVAGITKEETKEPDTTKTDAKAKKLKEASNLVNPVLNKSKEIKTSGTKIKYTRSMIKAMGPEEFKKHEPEIDKELAAGRIPDR